ncbi:transposase [Ralstonia mannitolilytica]|uniref:transposase n=1 Tax=Ralstonia mannitolilytica TaxID=105219 RepID=UPI0037422801
MLSDVQYGRIVSLLPGKIPDPGRTAADNRLSVEAVLWIARNGSPWHDLPHDFRARNSEYKRFARWSRAQVWHAVFAELAGDADVEDAFFDSAIVRAHQHAAGAIIKTVAKRSAGRAAGRALRHRPSAYGCSSSCPATETSAA